MTCRRFRCRCRLFRSRIEIYDARNIAALVRKHVTCPLGEVCKYATLTPPSDECDEWERGRAEALPFSPAASPLTMLEERVPRPFELLASEPDLQSSQLACSPAQNSLEFPFPFAVSPPSPSIPSQLSSPPPGYPHSSHTFHTLKMSTRTSKRKAEEEEELVELPEDGSDEEE